MHFFRILIKFAASAVVAVGISGCTADSGVYVSGESGKVFQLDSPPREAPRVFELPESLDAVAPLAREGLIGRWRCYVDEGILSPVNGSGSVYMNYCSWHLDEYEFREDGTYSMWHVSKDNAQPLPNTEVGGKWKYGQEGLSILQEYESRAKAFGQVERNALGTRAKWTDYTVTWHSSRELTIRYRDPGAFVRSTWGSQYPVSGWYDKEGCFRTRVLMQNTVWNCVTGPLRFKKR